LTKGCIPQPHRIHVAEVVGIPDEGKIVVVIVCLDCGDVQFHEKVVTSKRSNLRLLKEEKGEK